MRAVVQRVGRAQVRLPSGECRSINRGFLIYVGIGRKDSLGEAAKLARKISQLRIFSDAGGKFAASILDEKGEALVISQFTLYANLKGGRRPDFIDAAPPDLAKPLYESFVRELASLGIPVKTGEFGASMEIESVNLGPVTIWMDTELF